MRVSLVWVTVLDYFVELISTNVFVSFWALPTFRSSVRSQCSSTRASASGRTKSLYNGGLLREPAELAS